MKCERKYNYFYKITNLVNGKYYYGIHSTDNLDDGYLGSGITIRRAIEKYGKENFEIEFVKFFDTRNELVEYEKQNITEEQVLDKMCYNECVGGTGGFLSKRTVAAKDRFGNVIGVEPGDTRLLSGELVSVLKNVPKDENTKSKISESEFRFYETEDGKRRKKQISKEREEYWNSEKGNEMKEWISKHNKAYYATEEGRAVNARRIKAITGVPKSMDWKEQHSKDMKEFWKTEKGIELRKKFASKAVCTEHKQIYIPKYDLYEILEYGTTKPILTNAKRIDLVRYFGVKGINVNDYIGGKKPYKVNGKKYRIEKRVIEGMSVHTYRPSDISKD
jgi:hypothetical protein